VTLFSFFALTYLLSWACFIAGGTVPMPDRLRGLVFTLGAFGPAIAALWLTARARGRAGTAALLRGVLRWEVSARWYAFAVGFMLTVKLTTAPALRVATGSWPRFGTEPWFIIAVAIVISTPFQAGEEVGWRGYALPRLAQRLGLRRASLLLGVIWAVWHLPLFFVGHTDTTGQSFPVFLLEVTALSVVLAWLFARTNGSLLLTMLMHSAVNQTIGVVPSTVPGATRPLALSTSPVAWVTVGLLWIGAVYCLTRMPSVDLLPLVAPRSRTGETAPEPAA
jgi:membrane protease YdiL (CAAX protease family)